MNKFCEQSSFTFLSYCYIGVFRMEEQAIRKDYEAMRATGVGTVWPM